MANINKLDNISINIFLIPLNNEWGITPKMNNDPQVVVRGSQDSILAVNSVLKNTYLLLSMTLLFSALTAWIAMRTNMPHFNILVFFGGVFALLFLTSHLRNSAWGILSIFALTGFMGLTLGPIINFYLTALSNGSQLVCLAMGGTGAIFLGLSSYALISKKDFSFMDGFLRVGILTAFLCGVGAWAFSIPTLSLAVAAVFVLLMSGLILYETSSIIHGGETNYIMATIMLYISIYNLFISLLHILGAFAGEE